MCSNLQSFGVRQLHLLNRMPCQIVNVTWTTLGKTVWINEFIKKVSFFCILNKILIQSTILEFSWDINEKNIFLDPFSERFWYLLFLDLNLREKLWNSHRSSIKFEAIRSDNGRFVVVHIDCSSYRLPSILGVLCATSKSTGDVTFAHHSDNLFDSLMTNCLTYCTYRQSGLPLSIIDLMWCRTWLVLFHINEKWRGLSNHNRMTIYRFTIHVFSTIGRLSFSLYILISCRSHRSYYEKEDVKRLLMQLCGQILSDELHQASIVEIPSALS